MYVEKIEALWILIGGAGLTLQLTINPLKSVFGQEKVKFLGHRVSTSGIRLLPSQVEAVVAFQHPSTHA